MCWSENGYHKNLENFFLQEIFETLWSRKKNYAMSWKLTYLVDRCSTSIGVAMLDFYRCCVYCVLVSHSEVLLPERNVVVSLMEPHSPDQYVGYPCCMIIVLSSC